MQIKPKPTAAVFIGGVMFGTVVIGSDKPHIETRTYQQPSVLTYDNPNSTVTVNGSIALLDEGMLPPALRK